MKVINNGKDLIMILDYNLKEYLVVEKGKYRISTFLFNSGEDQGLKKIKADIAVLTEMAGVLKRLVKLNFGDISVLLP